MKTDLREGFFFFFRYNSQKIMHEKLDTLDSLIIGENIIASRIIKIFKVYERIVNCLIFSFY